MKKLAFYRLMLSLRRNILLFLFYMVCYLVLSIVVINHVTYWLAFDYPDFISIVKSGDRSLLQDLVFQIIIENQTVYHCISALFTLALIWLFSLRLPLQLPGALYVCPAGKADKLHYLRLYLAGKITLLVLLLLIITYTAWGGFFFYLQPPALVVQISLTAFLFLAFSLNPDPGNRKEALKKCPDIVTERSSKTFVSVYWSGLLILENTIFYSVLYVKPNFSWFDTLWWLPALALNIWLTRRHVTPVLEIMLDYEKLYFPIRE